MAEHDDKGAMSEFGLGNGGANFHHSTWEFESSLDYILQRNVCVCVTHVNSI